MSPRPLRLFLADDEPPARNRIRELLEDLRTECPTEVVGEAGNGLEVLERLPAIGADVLLLDISMPGLTGLEVARHLAKLDAGPAIVFVTAHDAHAVEAFELNALDYLLKPVRAARLAAALAKARAAGAPSREALAQAATAAREHIPVAERNRIVLVPVREVVYLRAELKYVTLRTRQREHLIEESLVSLERAHSGPRAHFSIVERNRIHLVPLAGVLYFKAELKYVTLRTREKEHLIEESLVSLEKEVPEAFIRIHRNCLVARAAIAGFERNAEESESGWAVVVRQTGERLAVSRRQQQVVKDFR